MHVTILCNRLIREGAKRVFICASHASLDHDALVLLDLSPITQIVFSDSIPLPTSATHVSKKVIQLSIAPLIAKVIASDLAHNTINEFNPDNEEDRFIME